MVRRQLLGGGGLVALLVLVVLQYGCVAPRPTPNLFAPSEEQVKLRSVQTRTFELADRKVALRGVVAALQDLGFLIERVNEPMGVVTAARFAEPSFSDLVAVTVTVRPQSEGRMLVRANAIFNNRPVVDPVVYQNFFASLERSLFASRE